MLGALAAGCLMLVACTGGAATVLSKAPNAQVIPGLPFASLEFENPLSGSEMVLSHPVLEWRDADYAPGPPPWYDDWSVNAAGGLVFGNANEIYMTQAGQSVWTTTTVPSTMVSIHLNGDDNDGWAQVLVDGIEVAQLDMYTSPCCQTMLIIVKGLNNTTHTITVNDLGARPNQPWTDVHMMGAAALGESAIKWEQPPVGTNPTNWFYGWNESSMEDQPLFAADDWVCTNASPVTKIRWWGSFLNWTEPYLPQQPIGFLIRFWTDVPKGADPNPQFQGFSHPGQQTGPTIFCTNFVPSFAGWDYDPRTKRVETCFQFEQTLQPWEYFYQDPGNGTNIYWISIQALLPYQTNVWGWKTRPRDTNSLAPDDAVRFDPNVPFYDPLWYPDPDHSWDLAFELFSQQEAGETKWEQWPDLIPQSGWDVRADRLPTPTTLADDFLCRTPGYLTNITVWGSWSNDIVPISPTNVTITLAIHDDIPPLSPPYFAPYSMPGAVKWQRTFPPSQIKCSVMASNLQEGWFQPPVVLQMPGDTICYQYDFTFPTNGAFWQEGTPQLPKIYWLEVQAQSPNQQEFGWKTCVTNWNDNAVWTNATAPFNSGWLMLQHSYIQRPIDLAFRLNTSPALNEEKKWSQPPEPYYPPDAYNGWNEKSVMDTTNVVADDWVCTNGNPVTDIHWWGSFIGWADPYNPPLPDAFRIRVWTDIPAGSIQGYSQPSNIVHEIFCTNFTCEFVGWDIDPRDAYGTPEACFKFEQDLREEEWWRQAPGTNIYWLSIEAFYTNGPNQPYPWGWKTRPRDPFSPAPDDAVRILSWMLIPPVCDPIEWPDPGPSWDLAFALTTIETFTPTNDFGDAPDSYSTRLPNGARHTVVPGVTLGVNIDAEPDGQPGPNALFDDNNPPIGFDDEDGVTLGGLIIPGEVASAQVAVSSSGYLSAWFDFDADGSWAQPGDQICNNVPVAPPGVAVSFFVPLTARAAGTNTFARFRFCTTNTVTSYTGQAPDGEVEDYQWYVEELDFGDAQDPTFPTLYASGGARHWIQPGVRLGLFVDAETNGQPNVTATGDDAMGLADEDGVALLTPLVPGQTARIQVTPSIPNGFLSGWIDFGSDGSWSEPSDQIFSALMLPLAGPQTLSFMVPPTAAGGSNVFARFRFTTFPGVISYTNTSGVVYVGEVEDYWWRIDQADFGDAPDSLAAPGYPTLLANNGAQHIIGPLYLGAGVDAELDGQPDAAATGDDLALTDDEDGVFFPTALIANAPTTIQVVSSGPGFLQGWFDFNRDGDWADPGEQPIVNWPVAIGTNLVNFFVPNAVAGKSYARFRLSTMPGLGYTNQAPDGEVEDYQVTFYPLKWNHSPELGMNGVDVNDRVPLADDFLCTQSGPITDIHLWGSFLHDILPNGGPANLNVTLTIYADIPAGPLPWSQPGQPLWSMTFGPNQFAAGLCWPSQGEWWHDPSILSPLGWIPNADSNIWQLDFYIPATNAFQQVSNTIYWLGAQYTPVTGDTNYSFGWKTTYWQWNDAACWSNSAAGGWQPLSYGDGHPQAPYTNLNLAFALSTEDLDWGDAPDPNYPTLAANNGARHVIVPGMTLGGLIDAEANGQPNATATGDDVNNLPDEDGVVFIAPPLIPGQPAQVQVTVTGSGWLNAWVDFAADGSWAQAGDQIFTNVALSTGVHTLNFMVPTTARWGANTFARFRFSSMANLSYTGLAPDGEVEDYAVSIHILPTSDLGDAPDSRNHAGVNMTAYPTGTNANYPTVFAQPGGPFGPMHANAGGAMVFLGAGLSGELDADWGPDQDFINNIIPVTDTADLDGLDDGLLSPILLPHCANGMLVVNATAPPIGPVMFLNIWCDWNRDGDWNDTMTCPDGVSAPEWAVANFAVPPPGGLFPLAVRSWHRSLTQEPLWIRITLGEQIVPGPLGFSGLAAGDGPAAGYMFGETEDYYLTNYDAQEQFDWGDAPAPFPTLLANNGARHLSVAGFGLGAMTDFEADGQPHPQALGDDVNNMADEDGIQFLGPVLINSNASVRVNLASGPAGGRLDAWLDFNGNSSWSDSGEQVFSSLAIPQGLSTNTFAVPGTAKLGTNFARFRLSSAGGLAPTGAAQDGEVEDYAVVIRQARPATNIVITNIVVTNLVGSATQQVATIYWIPEAGVQYQLRATATLSNIAWMDVGPVVIGPAYTQTETNSGSQRYYRVVAPYTSP
jgi:hypothetical protein